MRVLTLVAALLCAAVSAHAGEGKFSEGMASWYGRESGPRTASGARFHHLGATCAMRTHAWRWVMVTVLATGKSARCYVNDYGPATWTRRIIDVSEGVALELGFKGRGVARVRVEG